MTNTEIVNRFFKEGYENKNYAEVIDLGAEDYIDHSPAGASSNAQAVDGVHSGERMGIPATGKRISFEALENFKVVNGKIVESWGYWPDKEIEEKLR